MQSGNQALQGFKRKHILKLRKEVAGDNGKDLYLDCDGYMTVCICTLRKLILKRMNFTICKLYPNQPDTKKSY